jgi:hypothetical protein
MPIIYRVMCGCIRAFEAEKVSEKTVTVRGRRFNKDPHADDKRFGRWFCTTFQEARARLKEYHQAWIDYYAEQLQFMSDRKAATETELAEVDFLPISETE